MVSVAVAKMNMMNIFFPILDRNVKGKATWRRFVTKFVVEIDLYTKVISKK